MYVSVPADQSASVNSMCNFNINQYKWAHFNSLDLFAQEMVTVCLLCCIPFYFHSWKCDYFPGKNTFFPVFFQYLSKIWYDFDKHFYILRRKSTHFYDKMYNFMTLKKKKKLFRSGGFLRSVGRGQSNNLFFLALCGPWWNMSSPLHLLHML